MASSYIVHLGMVLW